MIFFVIILMVIILFFAVPCLWFDLRNNKVYEFRKFIIERAFGFSEKSTEKQMYACQLCEKWKYEEMLFSFKPLKFEEWFDENEIKFLATYELPR